ncbi:MAG TPA: hypothetical protein VJN96_04250 [Vicinamibacterales bacterium]|nr:hypothetical protein [Vicinamibacterales bacterium]
MARIRLAAVGIVVFCLGISASVTRMSAQAGTPLDAYKAYLDAAAKATTPEALFPFISKEYQSMLKNAPKGEVEKMLKMSIAKDKLTDIKVVSQKVDASKAVLELTAKTGDGRATSGKVTMVKEGGAWKTDEDAWATPVK